MKIIFKEATFTEEGTVEDLANAVSEFLCDNYIPDGLDYSLDESVQVDNGRVRYELPVANSEWMAVISLLTIIISTSEIAYIRVDERSFYITMNTNSRENYKELSRLIRNNMDVKVIINK